MHPRIALVGYCLFVLAMLVSFTAQAQERVALVIGNGAYQSATRLPNPSNDAADMASALRALDFTVVIATDVDKGAFDRKLRAGPPAPRLQPHPRRRRVRHPTRSPGAF
jgi:hypothetical protein